MADATVPKWKLLQNKKQSLYSNSTEKAQKVSRRNRGRGQWACRVMFLRDARVWTWWPAIGERAVAGTRASVAK